MNSERPRVFRESRESITDGKFLTLCNFDVADSGAAEVACDFRRFVAEVLQIDPSAIHPEDLLIHIFNSSRSRTLEFPDLLCEMENSPYFSVNPETLDRIPISNPYIMSLRDFIAVVAPALEKPVLRVTAGTKIPPAPSNRK